MGTISYGLRAAYSSGVSGVISIDFKRSFDVGAALTAGAGTITVNDADVPLVSALDAYAPLKRTGSAETPGPPVVKYDQLRVRTTVPETETVIERHTPDGWVPAPLTESRSPALADGQVVRKEGGAYVARDLAPHQTWTPADNNLLVATCDPAIATTAIGVSAGYIAVARIWVPQTITVTNLIVNIQAPGAGLAANQNVCGLYTSTGALIAKTASQHTAWQTEGLKLMALTAETGRSLTIAGGDDEWVYAAMLTNGTTAAKPSAGGGPLGWPLNAGLVAEDGYRSAYASTAGRTSLPATLSSAGTLQIFPGPIWFGVN